jgi:hypothetical protein
MKILTLSAITVLGAGLIAGQAGAAVNFGSLTLKPGETRSVDMSTSARTMRVCNDLFSSGAVIATIGGTAPHDLLPGVAEATRRGQPRVTGWCLIFFCCQGGIA